MDQSCLYTLGGLRQNAWGAPIDSQGNIRLAFRLVNGGIRCGVDNQLGAFIFNDPVDCLALGQIDLGVIQAQYFTQGRQRALKFPADLSGAA
jgi:hypothetical protein